MSSHDGKTPHGASSAPPDERSASARAADERLAQMRTQLEAAEAARAARQDRSVTTASASPTPSRNKGVWIFGGFCLLFFVGMIAFALTRPESVGFGGFEPLPELDPLEARQPLPAWEAPVIPAPEAESEEPAARRGHRSPGQAEPGNHPNIDLAGCGNDPLCGS